MRIEQFVMAYEVEQDRLRAMLPEGFTSLRPVLRINAEIRDGQDAYLELNTPVFRGDVRGWINIANWSSKRDGISFARDGKTATFTAPFLSISYKAVGITGGCPAEKENQGCFFAAEEGYLLQPPDVIVSQKEFCDCTFAWNFHEGDARGKSLGKTLPAFATEPVIDYEKQPFSAPEAAAIACRQVLGTYTVKFQREEI
ncbi:hypothetical protein ACPW7J_08240 [Ihubacter sp. rT4E-8]|uniref:hypothetical protein n=1 Tax=Ihubacter sp. rT4E-8 TaxID=3242369 RepID=UPI003CFB10A0